MHGKVFKHHKMYRKGANGNEDSFESLANTGQKL